MLGVIMRMLKAEDCARVAGSWRYNSGDENTKIVWVEFYSKMNSDFYLASQLFLGGYIDDELMSNKLNKILQEKDY